MIQRVIRNEDNSRIEAFLENGKVWVCIRTRFGFPEFEFDNEEDIHCFISELQGAMLRAKGQNKEEKKFVVDTGDGKPIDPIDLKYRRDNFKHTPHPDLCNCRKLTGTDRCTSRGCNNWNVFGQGTVDTTSNGTE